MCLYKKGSDALRLVEPLYTFAETTLPWQRISKQLDHHSEMKCSSGDPWQEIILKMSHFDFKKFTKSPGEGGLSAHIS